jgi:hypothetical protein
MKKWIKENVVGELPIVGAFFKGLDYSKACHHALKMSCEITGAIIGMITYMENASMPMSSNDDSMPMPAEHHSPVPYYSKMTASMLLGEMAGAVTFNTIDSLIQMAKNNYSFWNRDLEENLLPAHQGNPEMNMSVQ